MNKNITSSTFVKEGILGLAGLLLLFIVKSVVATPLAPQLYTPVENASLLASDVIFSWSPTGTDANYRIVISASENVVINPDKTVTFLGFTDDIQNKVFSCDTRCYTLPMPSGLPIKTTQLKTSWLTPGKTYFWKVRANDATGVGDWSTKVGSFTTLPDSYIENPPTQPPLFTVCEGNSPAMPKLMEIPCLMRKNGWNTAADLMINWFMGNGENYNISLYDVKKINPDLKDAVAKLKESSKTFDSNSDNIKKLYRQLLVDELVKTKNADGKPILFYGGAFDHIAHDAAYIKQNPKWAPYSVEIEKDNMHFMKEKKFCIYDPKQPLQFDCPLSDFFAAFGSSTIRLVTKGKVTPLNDGSVQITVTNGAVYFRDSYDFEKKDQFLGFWSYSWPYASPLAIGISGDFVPYQTNGWLEVTNKSFRDYNVANGKKANRGDFRIFSSFEEVKYDKSPSWNLTRYAKLSDKGAKDWSCTKDNYTGLVWEIKTDDGGLRDKDNTYSWYNPDKNTNGGFAGYQSDRDGGLGVCTGKILCNTNAYKNAVNKAKLCGYDDWRVPTHIELETLFPTNKGYFPDTLNVLWTSSPGENTPYDAWVLDVSKGANLLYKGSAYGVRLVRGKLMQ